MFWKKKLRLQREFDPTVYDKDFELELTDFILGISISFWVDSVLSHLQSKGDRTVRKVWIKSLGMDFFKICYSIKWKMESIIVWIKSQSGLSQKVMETYLPCLHIQATFPDLIKYHQIKKYITLAMEIKRK